MADSAQRAGASDAPRDEDPSIALQRCAELFNAGEYHAAHEVLDDLWERSGPGESDFYKGLIQACIALHHLRGGNLDGARKLYLGHRRFLAPFCPRHRGLEVDVFLEQMRRALAVAVDGAGAEAGEFEPRLDFGSGR